MKAARLFFPIKSSLTGVSSDELWKNRGKTLSRSRLNDPGG